MEQRILLVDDEADILEFISYNLIRDPPARRQKIADTLLKAYMLATTENGLPVRKEN